MNNSWVIYGLIAAFCFGIYIVIVKIIVDPKYYNFNIYSTYLIFGLSVFITLAAFYFTQGESIFPISQKSTVPLTLAAIAGIIWSVGLISQIKGASMTEVSKLTPLYNTNTIIVVLIGMVLLKELPVPETRLKVLIGAILVVIGGILVST